jgi:hypothetical protein
MRQTRSKKGLFGVRIFYKALPYKIYAPRKVLFLNEGAKRPMLRVSPSRLA